MCVCGFFLRVSVRPCVCACVCAQFRLIINCWRAIQDHEPPLRGQQNNVQCSYILTILGENGCNHVCLAVSLEQVSLDEVDPVKCLIIFPWVACNQSTWHIIVTLTIHVALWLTSKRNKYNKLCIACCMAYWKWRYIWKKKIYGLNMVIIISASMVVKHVHDCSIHVLISRYLHTVDRESLY